jgi:hypothetical protein
MRNPPFSAARHIFLFGAGALRDTGGWKQNTYRNRDDIGLATVDNQNRETKPWGEGKKRRYYLQEGNKPKYGLRKTGRRDLIC